MPSTEVINELPDLPSQADDEIRVVISGGIAEVIIGKGVKERNVTIVDYDVDSTTDAEVKSDDWGKFYTDHNGDLCELR